MDDLDYLFSTARIRAMEGRLLSREKLFELAESDSFPEDYEEQISTRRKELYSEIQAFAPDKRMVEIFRLKYDYHNIKCLLKARALGEETPDILFDCGKYSPERITEIMEAESYNVFSPAMRNSVVAAKEQLDRTGDYLLADLALDKACYKEMLSLAKATESSFFEGLVKLQIDSINLRTAVRLNQRKSSYEFLRQSFIEGGSVAMDKLLTELTPEALSSAFSATTLQQAAETGGRVLRGEERLGALDMACDNALMDYLKGAKYIGLGEQPLVAYLAAAENEFTALRIIYSGKAAGLNPEMIKERLRESYV